MSQHIVTLQTRLGSVQVIAGYDQTLDEAFLHYVCPDDREFTSEPHLTVHDLQPLVQRELQIVLPDQIIAAIQGDVAAMRVGENINRRITHYDPLGKVVQEANVR